MSRPSSTPSLPPAAVLHLTSGMLDAWAAGVAGVSDYWRRWAADPRGPDAILRDLVRWSSLIHERREPQWATDNTVVLETPVARLRDFSTAAPAPVVPTLVLPPQAGHHSSIVDFSPQQSQVRTIREAGLKRVYSMEWVGADAGTRDASITDYLDAVHQAVEAIGPPVNLIGDCQGGWFAAIYAALHPDHVNTLVLAGAPLDFHAGNAVIGAWVDLLTPGRDLSFYRGLVEAGGGVMRGDLLLGAFVLIRPDNEIGRQLALLGRLDDAEHVRRYRDFEDWFKYTQDLPGAFYLWIVEHLFRDNKLVAGTLEVDGRPVSLASITCPVHLLAGQNDHITPPAQVFIDPAHFGTRTRDVKTRLSSGGHLGLFMGREALGEHWPVLLADVARRSGVKDARPRRRREPGSDIALAY